MEITKGTRVILNQHVDKHPAGTRGRIIRVEVKTFSSTRYAMLVDDGGAVVEQLTDEQLYAPDED